MRPKTDLKQVISGSETILRRVWNGPVIGSLGSRIGPYLVLSRANWEAAGSLPLGGREGEGGVAPTAVVLAGNWKPKLLSSTYKKQGTRHLVHVSSEREEHKWKLKNSVNIYGDGGRDMGIEDEREDDRLRVKVVRVLEPE